MARAQWKMRMDGWNTAKNTDSWRKLADWCEELVEEEDGDGLQ